MHNDTSIYTWNKKYTILDKIHCKKQKAKNLAENFFFLKKHEKAKKIFFCNEKSTTKKNPLLRYKNGILGISYSTKKNIPWNSTKGIHFLGTT